MLYARGNAGRQGGCQAKRFYLWSGQIARFMIKKQHEISQGDNTMKKLGRCLTAMVTPFKETGEVDYEQTKKLAKALLNSGNDGLVLAATTGEEATLSWEEEMRIFTEVKSAVGYSPSLVASTASLVL